MTHLMPIYRPETEDRPRPQIHLEGEFEFPADMHGADVYTTLRERSELIGGVVAREKIDGRLAVRVYPWNGPGSFRLWFPAMDQTVEQIDVLDTNGAVVDEYPIEEMVERGKAAQVGVDYLNKHMSPAEDREPNWVGGEPENRYRIDFSEGELVPVDADGNEIEDEE